MHGFEQEIKDMKNTFKIYTTNAKKIDTLSDQISYIYNFFELGI